MPQQNQPDVVLVALWNGQVIEVLLENHQNWEVMMMNFICNDCAKNIHNVCRPGWCECQHKLPKPQVPTE